MAVLLEPVHRWSCPNCSLEDVTSETRPHSRFHSCTGLAGMTAPMVPAGMKCKVEATEREDFIGSDLVQVNADGRPVMNVKTTRDDGEDMIVFAPTAVLRSA